MGNPSAELPFATRRAPIMGILALETKTTMMDEFDFDDCPLPSPASSALSTTSGSAAANSQEISSQISEPASPSTPSISSPLRGRTKARRSRTVLRTGAQALAEAAAREERLGFISDDCNGQNSSAIAKVGSRKRALKESPSSSRIDNSNKSESEASATKSVQTPSVADTSQHSVDSKPCTTNSSNSGKNYGRRRKKRKPTPASRDTEEWDGTDDFQMKMEIPSNCVVDRILNKNANKETASSKMEMGTPPTPATPPSLHSGSIRSVRFSLTSNTQHFYKGYGTPPSTLQSNESVNDDKRIELCSASRNNECYSQSRQLNNFDSNPEATPRSLEEADDTERSLNENNGSGAEEHESAFVLGSKTTRQNSEMQERPALQGCLKQTTRLSQRARDSTQSPSPTKSDRSASSYGSIRAKRRKRSSRFWPYTQNYSQQLSQDNVGMYQSDSPETVVALGRRDDIQDVGSYRMMIDELSYLCSAILGCKKRTPQQTDGQQQIIKHNAVTAGAACDLADTISQSEMQTALLVLGGQKSNVGALTAVLEAIACAPAAVDWMEVCKEIVEGNAGKLKSEEDMKNTRHCQAESKKPILGGRTKSARRKQNLPEPINEPDSRKKSIGRTCLKPKEKYGAISSKALSLVAHFVSAICTANLTNSDINKASIKAARNAVLGHKASLQGIARLILADAVVDAYLRQESRSVLKIEVPCDNPSENFDSTLEDDQIDESDTSSSRRSSASATSEEVTYSSTLDPTKSGRRKGRKKKLSLQQAIASSPELTANPLETISEICDGENCSIGNLSWASEKNEGNESGQIGLLASYAKSDSLSFASDDASHIFRDKSVNIGPNNKVELISAARYQEKITSALSRACLNQSLDQAMLSSDLHSSHDDENRVCTYCSAWGQHLLNSHDKALSSSPMTAASIALDAADRIISGRDKRVPPTDEDEHSDEDSDDNFLEVKSNELRKNPIVAANDMMRKSGSLPDYSRSMASTIAAMLVLSRSSTCNAKQRRCNKCSTYLLHRMSSLSEIIDNLCCLSPDASKALSLPETWLIPSMLQLVFELRRFHRPPSSCISASIITSLKTLTTLTHENSSACEQILTYISPSGSISELNNGFEIVFRHLFITVTEIPNHMHHRSYDGILFCLNILANVAETIPSRTRDMFLRLIVNDNTNGISWLTQWIVSKTLGFQQAVMKGSFGSTHESSDESNDAELKSGEEGNLVTAGNGFVLLAYLMLDEDNGTAAVRIRDIITKELPIDESGYSGGIRFMIKTLKAFCNFYHYSVGDLSVAVIAPVVKLIGGLERIELIEHKANDRLL